MKIAYIIPSLSKSGREIVVWELVNFMVSHGNEVDLFYFDMKEKTIDFGCTAKRIGFLEQIDFSKYDVVHSHGMRPDMYVFFHKPLKKTKTLFVTTIHEIMYENLSYTYNKLVGKIFSELWIRMCSRHDRIVVLSNQAKQYYSKWVDSERISSIYNARNLDKSKTLTQEEEKEVIEFKGDSLLIGMNCQLTDRKGVDLGIQAISLMRSYKVKLFIVGDGQVRESLENLAARLKVDDRVYFAGYRDDAYRYIPHYDMYLMASRGEGFGLSMLEAVIYKCPIIISDIPIFHELFTSEEADFFSLDDIHSLVEAIVSARGQTKVNAAYRRYLEDYSVEKFGSRYSDVYCGRFLNGLHDI